MSGHWQPFFMAKIPAERHGVNISDLTTDEKRVG
jgi:hypothetical protein